MSNFKVGDKVVCIRPGDAVNGLIQDKVYTILDVFEDFSEAPSVEVLESMPPSPLHGYLAFRFRKATDADMPTAEEKLEKVN
jgi:hypothetical protein